MIDLTQQQLRAIFGRLILQMSVVWAAMVMSAAIASKASDDFIWVLLVMMTGFGLSSAVLESARRAALPTGRT